VKTRSIYFQYREGQINDGDVSVETDTDAQFDQFLDGEKE